MREISLVDYVQEVACIKCGGFLKVVSERESIGDVNNGRGVFRVRVFCRVCRKSKFIYVFMEGGKYCFSMELRKDKLISAYCEN